MNLAHAWLLSVVAVSLSGCGSPARIRMRAEGLEKQLGTVTEARALQCAPRELALARGHIRFAREDLDDADLQHAHEHLEVAEPNARAVVWLSRPEQCDPPQSEPEAMDADAGSADAELPESESGVGSQKR